MMKRLIVSALTLLMLGNPLSVNAATTFLEPGGDADFLVGTTNGFWSATNGPPTIVTDFVHGSHVKSIRYAPNQNQEVYTTAGTLNDSGSRISVYIYLKVLPTTSMASIATLFNASNTSIVRLYLTTGGVLQLWNAATAQIGTNGPTLSTGQWYRISLAYTITSTTVNRFELFVNGVSAISITNATLGIKTTSKLGVGNALANGGLDFRSSDLYIDNSSSLTDTGDIWVTAKRPNANGTTNGFTTQVGSGGSGYGTGHSPQVNERPLSTTNGWSMVGAGSAITEEYNVESASTGDINLTGASIVDYEGWVSASSLAGETASIIVNGSTSNISLTSTTTLFTKIAGSTTYPAGTGTDIGIITTTALTTVSLYEAGIIVAYKPILTVTTQSASSVTGTTATLNGNITALGGGANATVQGFAWGTSSTMVGDTATTTASGSFGTGAFTNTTNTYVCNTTYYSRAYATNSNGDSLGAISASFTTSACSSGFISGLRQFASWIWNI